MTMTMLASSVGALIGESYMADNTGLTGLYAVEVDYPPTRRSAGATSPDRTEVLTALGEQLGLKVEPAKVQIPVLVIDHIERPTEN
jgi:uncharacterized protein (TIGR03435 family)